MSDCRRGCRRASHYWISSLLALGLAILAGCQMAPQGSAPPGINSQETSISDAERKDRSERIRDYFREQQKRRNVVATTVTRSGQTIDWIRADAQVDGGKLASPPMDKPAEDPTLVLNNPYF